MMKNGFLKLSGLSFIAVLFGLLITAFPMRAQQPTPTPSAQTTAPKLEEWRDDFDGFAIDAAKWERVSIAGGDAQIQVKNGQLRQTGAENSRSGVRTKQKFSGSRFVAEANLIRVAPAPPQDWGNAMITVLFDDAGRERLEWIVRHDGGIEAWDITGGKFERFDDRQLKAKTANVKLGIARRGDDFYFTIDDEVKLQRAARGLPNSFRVMLYGFGTSENVWDAARVVVQPPTTETPASAPSPPAQPAPTAQTEQTALNLDVWSDDFNADSLDQTKWEQYTFEGAGNLKVEQKDGQLRLRGSGASRAGVRSKNSFRGERFLVEATLAKTGTRLPNPGQTNQETGFAILAVMFDGSPTNRIEWILRSDRVFEAWDMTNNKFERVDNNKLGTKEKSPRLGIARRGDEIFFLLNGEVGLQRTVRNLPSNFRVMLYGFGSSENQWDAITVQTPK